MSWMVWITGLPGSGKTTLAWRTAEALASVGRPAQVLEYDDVRDLLRSAGARTDEESVHGALVAAAVLMAGAGVPVIVAATGPRRAWRDLARARIAQFAEVQLDCPLPVACARERAVRWNLTFEPACRRPRGTDPDIVLHYERSLAPELTLRTAEIDVPLAVREIMRLVERLEGASAVR